MAQMNCSPIPRKHSCPRSEKQPCCPLFMALPSISRDPIVGTSGTRMHSRKLSVGTSPTVPRRRFGHYGVQRRRYSGPRGQPTARNNMPRQWIYGFLGVSAEAMTPGWAASLSSDEARAAVAYATIELGGFAPFIVDLAKSHPAEVREVIAAAKSAPRSASAATTLICRCFRVWLADGNLKQLLIPGLLDELMSWPSNFTDEAGPALGAAPRPCACISWVRRRARLTGRQLRRSASSATKPIRLALWLSSGLRVCSGSMH